VRWSATHGQIAVAANRGDRVRPATEAASLLVLAQYLAGLSVDEVEPKTRWTGDAFIFVVGHILVVVEPMLDVHRCRRALENERGHAFPCIQRTRLPVCLGDSGVPSTGTASQQGDQLRPLGLGKTYPTWNSQL
jgi:hypothetical protein